MLQSHVKNIPSKTPVQHKSSNGFLHLCKRKPWDLLLILASFSRGRYRTTIGILVFHANSFQTSVTLWRNFKKENKLVQIAQERELQKVLKVGLLFGETQKNNCDTRKKDLTYFSG